MLHLHIHATLYSMCRLVVPFWRERITADKKGSVYIAAWIPIYHHIEVHKWLFLWKDRFANISLNIRFAQKSDSHFSQETSAKLDPN